MAFGTILCLGNLIDIISVIRILRIRNVENKSTISLFWCVKMAFIFISFMRDYLKKLEL